MISPVISPLLFKLFPFSTELDHESEIFFPLLLCCHVEYCHVQPVGFVGVDNTCLRRNDFCRNKVVLDGIGVYIA